MQIASSDLKRLSALLDDALDLEPDEREQWLCGLAGDDAALVPRLRTMLEGGRGPDAASIDSGAMPSVRATAPFVAGDQVGPYRLLQPLGQGGMGEVWLAERTDGRWQRRVALKLPTLGLQRAALVQHFARERDILGALSHAHIAPLYDAGIDDHRFPGQPYLALEYVQGAPITEWCAQHRLDASARIALFLQVVDAVQYAHSRLVVHRDLKPGNVFVGSGGRVRLLDFGIAKLLQPVESPDRQGEPTLLGGRVLTPDYAAPEQVRDEPVSTTADIWALGVLLYELLAGVRPFRGAHRAEVEAAVLERDPPRPSLQPGGVARTLPRLRAAELDTIVGKALHKQPAGRYATAAALAEDLQRWAAGLPVLAQPDRLSYRLRKFVERNRSLTALGTAAALAVVVAAGLALWQAVEARQQAASAQAQAERARREARRAEAVQEFLLDIFRTNRQQQADPLGAQRTTARELLDIGATRVDRALAEAPESQIQVLATLTDLYLELGLRDRAVEFAQRRAQTARRVLAANDPRRADALLGLARFLHDGGARAQGRLLLDEAAAVLDAAGDEASAFRGRLLLQRARFNRYESLREAIASADAAVAVERLQPKPDFPLLHALQVAGVAHLTGHDYIHAEPLLAEAWKLSQALGERRAAAELVAATDVADVWQSIGRLSEAEAVLRGVVDRAEGMQGRVHGVTLVLQIHLANLLLETGRAREGDELLARVRDGIAQAGDRLGRWWLNNAEYLMARTLVERGAPLRALPPLEPGIQSMLTDLPRSGSLAHRLRQKAEALIAAGRVAEAGPVLDQAESVWARYTADPPGRAGSAPGAPLNSLAMLHARGRWLLASGRPQEAAETLRRMPPASLPDPGDLDAWAQRRDVALAECAVALGDPEGALRLARGVTDRLALVENRHGSTLVHVHALAWRAAALAHLALGQTGPARAAIEQSMRWRLEHDLPDSVWMLDLRALARRASSRG